MKAGPRNLFLFSFHTPGLLLLYIMNVESRQEVSEILYQIGGQHV